MLDKVKETAKDTVERVGEWAEENPHTVRKVAHDVIFITACCASALWGMLFTKHTYSTYLQGMSDGVHAVADAFEAKKD